MKDYKNVMSTMKMNDYQEQAMTTRMASCNNFAYMFLNLVGEVGELAEKTERNYFQGELKDVVLTTKAIGSLASLRAKKIRKWEDTELMQMRPQYTEEEKDLMKKECGDILWQLGGFCDYMGWTLEEVAEQNLEKLASRKARGVIDGNGDNR